MAIRDFIETHEAFTADELLEACPGGRSTNRRLLSWAVDKGRVTKVMRGLYVSRTGLFEGSDPAPEAVCEVLAPEVWLHSTSALVARAGLPLKGTREVFLASEARHETSGAYVSHWELDGTSYSRRSVDPDRPTTSHSPLGQLEAQDVEAAWVTAVSPRSPEAGRVPLGEVLRALAHADPDPDALLGLCAGDRDAVRALAAADALGRCDVETCEAAEALRQRWVEGRFRASCSHGTQFVGLFCRAADPGAAWWPRWALTVPAGFLDAARVAREGEGRP